MIRVEIVSNHSVEENLFEAFREEGVGKFYTKYPSIFGVGSSGPRMGDSIWPEENFAIVVWCDEAEAQGLERAVAKVKTQFPGEGIKLFRLREAPVVIMQALPASPASSSPSSPPSSSQSSVPEPESPPPVYQVYDPYGPEEENN